MPKRKKRISPRTLQDNFRTAADEFIIDKKLHARLFRHTACDFILSNSRFDISPPLDTPP